MSWRSALGNLFIGITLLVGGMAWLNVARFTPPQDAGFGFFAVIGMILFVAGAMTRDGIREVAGLLDEGREARKLQAREHKTG